MQAIPLPDGLSVIDHGPTYTLALDDGDDVILFDCGLDASAGKKIAKLFDGRRVSRLYLTHSHADHMGASAHFAKKFGTEVFVAPGELTFVQHPETESGLLYGGASYPQVRTRFLCAEPVPNAKPLSTGIAGDTTIRVGDTVITPVDLSGHSPAQTGYLVNETFFVGDALFSPEIVEKYGVLYLYDAKAYVASLARLADVPAREVVFCHKGRVSMDEAKAIAANNIAHVDAVRAMVADELVGDTAEALSRRIMKNLGIPETMELVLLVTSTIKGYLAWLAKENEAAPVVGDGGIHWERTA